MKTISKQLLHPISEDTLKTRIEKDAKARNEISDAVSSGEYSPKDSEIMRDEDPSTWISASGLTDASLHRLSCRIAIDGRQSLCKAITKLHDESTHEFILNLLNIGGKVGYMLRELLGEDVCNSNPDHHNTGLSDIMVGTNNRENSRTITAQLINYWSKRTKSRRNRLITSEEGAKILSSRFLSDIEYAVSEISDHIRAHVSPTRGGGGITFDSVYCSNSHSSDLEKKLECLTDKGIAGVFQQVYAMTKGYSNPMCRSCLYSPKTKTFWYGLRPITLSCDRGDGCSHTFSGIWIQWNPAVFAASMSTYAENSIKVIRTGDLTEESTHESYLHPHVGDHSNICLGGASGMFTLAADTLALSASMDVVISVLNDYAAGDAYASLKRFSMTEQQWEEEDRGDDDSDESRWCEECGDEIDTNNDVYEDGMWFHQEDCCHWSEHESRYISESNAVYSEHYDSYIYTGYSVHTCADSSREDYYSADDSDNICQLWLPDTLDDLKERLPCSGNEFTVYGMDSPTPTPPQGGCIV